MQNHYALILVRTVLFAAFFAVGAVAQDEPAEELKKKRSASRAEKRSEEHTSELKSRRNLVCRLLLEKKKHSYHMTH